MSQNLYTKKKIPNIDLKESGKMLQTTLLHQKYISWSEDCLGSMKQICNLTLYIPKVRGPVETSNN